VQREPVPGVVLGLRLDILHNANATAPPRATPVNLGVRRIRHQPLMLLTLRQRYQMSAPAPASLDGSRAARAVESQPMVEPSGHQVIVFEQEFVVYRLALGQAGSGYPTGRYVGMAGCPDNVLMLPSQRGARKSAHVEALRATVKQLDELACSLQHFSPRISWSAQRCMIASTSLRMWLTGARKRLDDLATSRLLGEEDGARWSLELNDACLEAERRLHDIDVCLHTLQRVESSLAERDRGIETFASGRSELLTVLNAIRLLITQRAAAGLGGR
jgi:hypothetical protein